MKLIFSLPKCYNRYLRKATKYEQLNEKKVCETVTSSPLRASAPLRSQTHIL